MTRKMIIWAIFRRYSVYLVNRSHVAHDLQQNSLALPRYRNFIATLPQHRCHAAIINGR